MTTYFVGDVQGCFSELIALLEQVNFNAKQDTLYLAGDLVARGPHSLATLRFVKSLGHAAKVVLGNHDIHLLAVYDGIKKAKSADKLDELFAADDINELITWLAQQPLLQKLPKNETGDDDVYLTHAGISPQWTMPEAIEQARSAQQKLSSLDRKYWLELMYGESPNNWLHAKSTQEKFRFTVNALTRMRYCFSDGSLEFEHKGSPNTAQEHNNFDRIIPWYKLANQKSTTKVIFGHWASLMGECPAQNVYALDTGCVWGKHLTLLRWHDKKIFTEQAHPISSASP